MTRSHMRINSISQIHGKLLAGQALCKCRSFAPLVQYFATYSWGIIFDTPLFLKCIPVVTGHLDVSVFAAYFRRMLLYSHTTRLLLTSHFLEDKCPNSVTNAGRSYSDVPQKFETDEGTQYIALLSLSNCGKLTFKFSMCLETPPVRFQHESEMKWIEGNRTCAQVLSMLLINRHERSSHAQFWCSLGQRLWWTDQFHQLTSCDSFAPVLSSLKRRATDVYNPSPWWRGVLTCAPLGGVWTPPWGSSWIA